MILPDFDKFAPTLERISKILDEETPVNQQIILEMLTVRHATGMRDLQQARFVIESMGKHAKQILNQVFPSLN